MPLGSERTLFRSAARPKSQLAPSPTHNVRFLEKKSLSLNTFYIIKKLALISITRISSISSKKQTKTSRILVKTNWSVRFLEEIDDPKNLFEINWLLASQKMSRTKFCFCQLFGRAEIQRITLSLRNSRMLTLWFVCLCGKPWLGSYWENCPLGQSNKGNLRVPSFRKDIISR